MFSLLILFALTLRDKSAIDKLLVFCTVQRRINVRF